jgi:hypothetical protein
VSGVSLIRTRLSLINLTSSNARSPVVRLPHDSSEEGGNLPQGRSHYFEIFVANAKGWRTLARYLW